MLISQCFGSAFGFNADPDADRDPVPDPGFLRPKILILQLKKILFF
jgi:hypothetical protein